MSLMLMVALQATTALPLPQKTDIQADFSTVICPNEAAARRMLDNHYVANPAPRNYGINTDLFFAGLKATGCVQGGPDAETIIEIKQALARKTIRLASDTEIYLLYRGVNGRGKTVVGIVDEPGNNKFPRNDYERWLVEWTRDGVITVSGNADADPVYSCATPLAARNAVKAVPLKGTERVKRAAFSKALAANKCSKAARGQYRVATVHEDRTISCGYECEDNYTALTATRGGRTVGLIFDASHF